MFYVVGKLKEVFESDSTVALTVETEHGEVDMETTPKVSAIVNDAEYDYMEPVIATGEIVNNGAGMILLVEKLVFISSITKSSSMSDDDAEKEMDKIVEGL